MENRAEGIDVHAGIQGGTRGIELFRSQKGRRSHQLRSPRAIVHRQSPVHHVDRVLLPGRLVLRLLAGASAANTLTGATTTAAAAASAARRSNVGLTTSVEALGAPGISRPQPKVDARASMRANCS